MKFMIEMEYNMDADENVGAEMWTDVITYNTYPERHSLNVYEPAFGSSFSSGGTLSVKWEALNWMAGEKVNIYLYKDVSGPDPCLFSQTDVSVSSEKFDFTIPSAESGSNYYIYIGYDCGSMLCSEGFFSERFSINYHGSITITNDIQDTIIYLPGEFRVTWTASIPSADPIYVSIKAKYPSIIPLSDKTLCPVVKTTAGAGSALLKPEGTMYPAYIEIAYNCVVGKYFCKTVTSKTFKMMDQKKYKWNIDDEKKILEPHYEVGIFGSAFDDSSVSCENCYARAAAGLFDLEFEFVGSAVKSFQVGFYGEADYSLNLIFDVSTKLSKSASRQLFKYTVPSGTGFFIGKVSVGLTITLIGEIPVSFDTQADLLALVQSRALVTVSAYAQYGERVPPDQKGVLVTSDISNKLTPRYELSANVDATLKGSLRLRLHASFFDVVELDAYTEGKAELHADFSEPPFPGLGREKLVEDTAFSHGSCVNSHRLRYRLDLTAGAHAEAEYLFANEPPFTKDYDLPFRYTLLSGCMLETDSNAEVDKVHWKMCVLSEINRDSIPVKDDKVLEIEIANELCQALGWRKGSLSAKLRMSEKRDRMITGINLTLFPSGEQEEQFSAEEELEVNLVKALQNSNSTFYSGAIGKYFNEKFVFTELISSSSFIAPAFFVVGLACFVVASLPL